MSQDQDPPRPSSPVAAVADPPPPPSVADTIRHVADETRRHIRAATRALRAATRTAGEVAVFGAAAYALGNALLDLCPWCKKGLKKVINPPFCPSCHRDMLAWSEELQEEWELQCKSIRASNKMEKREKEAELLRRLREEGVARKTRSNKVMKRE